MKKFKIEIYTPVGFIPVPELASIDAENEDGAQLQAIMWFTKNHPRNEAQFRAVPA